MQRLAAAAVAAAIVIGGGCGGDSSTGASGQDFSVIADTTMTTGSLPTKARFVARVNQICRNGWKVILQNFDEYSSWQSPSLSEQQLFAKSVRLSYLAGVDFHIFDEIQNLGAPKGEERAAEDVIGTMQIAVERGQRVVPVPTTAKLEALFADYNRVAGEYGFDECLVDSSHLPETAPPA
jgi:hypothetical protein